MKGFLIAIVTICAFWANWSIGMTDGMNGNHGHMLWAIIVSLIGGGLVAFILFGSSD